MNIYLLIVFGVACTILGRGLTDLYNWVTGKTPTVFHGYKMLGEFQPHKDGLDKGVPNLIQSWVPLKFKTDLDPAKRHFNSVWCVSLGYGKRVELRSGDRVVVLRPRVTK
jgi:hypothetical protein